MLYYTKCLKYKYLTRALLFSGGVDVYTTITAVTDHVIPSSSPDDVEFSCEVAGDADYSPLWVLSGRQLPSTSPGRFIIADSGDGLSSTLTVTAEGRRSVDLDLITVACHADNSNNEFRIVEGLQILYIVLFGKTMTICSYIQLGAFTGVTH